MSMRAVLVLLSSFITISSTTDINQTLHFHTQKNIHIDAGENYEFCFVPCAVQTNDNRSLINPPFVSWERKKPQVFSFVPLKNWTFWKEYGLFFYHYPNYCKLREGSNGIYDCDLYIRPCAVRYQGLYLCNVYHFDTGTEISRHVTLDIGRSNDAAEKCVNPDPILNADLLTDNGSLSVNFSWTFAPLENENDTICRHVYSVRSFWSSVPYDLEDGKEPTHGRSIRYTQVDQLTHHIFDDINRVTYYQFELRIQANLGATSATTYKQYSFLYYFGDQVSARVTEPIPSHSVIRARLGEQVTIPCDGAGTPTPSVFLLREVTSQPPSACSGCPTDKGNNIPAVNFMDAGEYFCVAANTLVNPPLGKRIVRDWKTIMLIVEPVVETLTNVSQCLPYTQSTCAAFLDHEFLVYVNETNVNGNALQEQIQSLFRRIDRRANRSEVSNLNSMLRDKCLRLAKSIACHSVYPYCDSDHSVPTPRLICKATCDSFAAGGLCEGFISQEASPELYERLTANCDTREHPGGSNPECIPISLETAEIGHYSPTGYSLCSSGTGRSYAGDLRRTRSGLDCQSWASQSPHKHPFWPFKYSSELIPNPFACRNPGGVGDGPWCYTSDPNVRWEYCDVPQCEVCQQYRGYSFCNNIEGYADGNRTVYVDTSTSKWGRLGLESVERYLENLLPQLTGDMGNDTWTPGCEHSIRQLFCHITLPFCKNQEAAAPLSVCSDHCKLLDTIQFCATGVYLRVVQKLRDPLSKFYFRLDDCVTTDVSNSPSSGPDCMPPPQGLTSDTDGCYISSDHGQSYTGQLATTQMGERCQSWDKPHLLFHPDLYLELDSATNLCRNPGQLKNRIWCFTSKSAWNYCPIPTNCTTVSAPTGQGHWKFTTPIVSTVMIMLFFCTILFIFVYCYVKCRKHKQQRSRSPPLSLSSDSKTFNNSTKAMIDNQTYVTFCSTRLDDTIRKFKQLDSQIPRRNVRYVRQIGQGNFGVVFMGRMVAHDYFSSNKDDETMVAVKTLKDECQEALEDFAREARIMLQLDHPNIIKLYGVSTDDSPFYLVFEYMDLGDLSKFLRDHASSRQRRLMDPSGYRRSRTESTLSDDPPSLSHHQLADMCKQIAAGMEYLADRCHVHRDLACRNCLVKSCTNADETCSGVIVKIGDFGMSHDLYQKNYYRVEGQAVLPIRWMSPEAVIFGKFSTAGDVWSFGVTMWEIFSFAMQPYFGFSNEEVTKYIRTGRHLERPNDCPEKIYAIMQQCWALEPDERPTFCDLQDQINEVRISLSSESSGEGHIHPSPPSSIDEEEEENDNVFEESPIMRRGHITIGGYRPNVNGDRFDFHPPHLPPRLDLRNDNTPSSSSDDSTNSAMDESYA